MQWHAERHTKFFVQTELLETKEVLTNILSEIPANKLFATVVESTRSVGSSVVESGPKKLSIVGAHPIMHTRKLRSQSFDIVLDVCFQALQINTVHLERMQNGLFLGEPGDPVRGCTVGVWHCYG